MKKYIIFALSFIVIFALFQVLSGLLLTFVYVPDIEHARNMSMNQSQETVINSSYTPFLPSLVIAFLSASIAYFISNKTSNWESK